MWQRPTLFCSLNTDIAISPALTVTAAECAYDDDTERCKTDLTLRPLKPLKNKVTDQAKQYHCNARSQIIVIDSARSTPCLKLC